MCMGKKVVTAILIIPLTLRAETELKLRITVTCPATHGAFVLGYPVLFGFGHIMPVFHTLLNLSWIELNLSS